MSDPSSMTLAVAPGVALTSAVIYWANLTGRLDTISARVRSLNAELRASAAANARTRSVEKQIEMLRGRARVLHVGVICAVTTLVAFLISSAVLFFTTGHEKAAAVCFMVGLSTFGLSLVTTLWEMLWSRLSLDEDIESSRLTREP
jgi:hypothetical protein